MNGEALAWLGGIALGLVFVVPSALRLRREQQRARVEMWKRWLLAPDPEPGAPVVPVANPLLLDRFP